MQTDHQSTYKSTINADIDKVWKALTDPAIVKQYFLGTDLKTDWKVGNPVTWSGQYEGTTYLDKGVVLEYVPKQKLSFSYLSSWTGLDDKPENYLVVSYEVRRENDTTVLIITQSNYDAEKAKHSNESWASIIDALKKLIE